MRFPDLTGDDLLRRRVRVPSGLEGNVNIVLVAFQRWHQGLVDSWLPAVARLEERYPDLRHYELPVLPAMGWVSRTFINEGMRAGIPDHSTRAATITLYVDRPAFLRALDLPTDQTIYVLVLEGDGTVLWRRAGAFEPGEGRELAEAVAAAFGSKRFSRSDGTRTAEPVTSKVVRM